MWAAARPKKWQLITRGLQIQDLIPEFSYNEFESARATRAIVHSQKNEKLQRKEVRMRCRSARQATFVDVWLEEDQEAGREDLPVMREMQ